MYFELNDRSTFLNDRSKNLHDRAIFLITKRQLEIFILIIF